MVLGKRLPSMARDVLYDEQRSFGEDEYFEYFDFAIVPHMDGTDFVNCTEDIVLAQLKEFQATTYCLQDTQAISVDGDTMQCIGG